MKVLFLISTIISGGAARVLTCLANRFVQSGDEVAFVTSYIEEGEYPLDSRVKRIPLETSVYNGNPLSKNIRWIKRLDRICEEFEPDVAVSFLPEPNFRLLLLKNGKKFARIVSVRSDPAHEYSSKVYRFIADRLYRKADGVVFQTTGARDFFNENIASHSKVIFNQVDERFFGVKYDGERRNIVTTGRLDRAKNHKMLIDAFSLIADKTDQDLIIYGEGDTREQLEQQINSLGLTDRVKLPGSVENVADVVKSARLYILSSDYEGMPNALLEALALGVPSISTDCPSGGAYAAIKDGVNGFLVPVGDAQAMAEKMEYALTHYDQMSEMGENAARMAEQFHPDTIYNQWRDYIITLAQQKKNCI